MASSQTTKPRETPDTRAVIAPLAVGLPPHLIGTLGEAKPQGATPVPAQIGILHHRVREIAWHTPWYGFKTQARLARDAQVAPSTVSRLLRGKELPSLVVALRLAGALSHRSGLALDLREVFSLDGTYPTPSVCALMGCRSCLPPSAFDRDDNLREGFQAIEAGQWSLAPRPQTKGGRR